MSIGFDAPENPNTTLNLNGWIVGKKFAQVEKYMRTTYEYNSSPMVNET